MSDFTPQDPNLRLPGQPWTSAKAIADAENPIAIIKSAVGAPRPLTAAEFRASQPFSVSAGEVIVGPFVHSGNFSSQSNLLASYASAGTITILPNVSGVMRFRTGFTTGPTIQARLLRNGSEVFFFESSDSSGTRTTDQSVSANDTFEWEFRRADGSGSVGLQPEPPRGNDNIESRSLFTYGSQA